MFRKDGAGRVHRWLGEALESKQVRPDQFSLRELFEHLVPEGREVLRRMDTRKSGGWTLLEAANAVDTSTFSNITGQIFYNKVLEGYARPGLLWPELCETFNTQILDAERIAGIGGIGDLIEVVEEKQPFPYVGMNEEWVDAPATKKRGFIAAVTREMIIADRTGLLMQRAGDGGWWMSLNKEKRVQDGAFGITNTYTRNGVATNTYLTSGAYINSLSNPLIDWTSVEAAELYLDAINDPNTGEAILFQPTSIIVPSALKRTAMRVQMATQIRVGAGEAGSVATYSPNPMDQGYYGAAQYKILASPYVKRRTSSASTWFFGDPKLAFGYREVWGIETIQAPANSEADFERDISYRYRVSERGEFYVRNPRFMVKCT